jgi:signal peptidase II
MVLVVLTVFVCLRRDLRWGELCGYAFILAGGMSNMIDRVLAGVVIDFMNIGIGSLRTGIFNVADMAIMAGLFVVIGAHMMPPPREEPEGVTQA